MSKRIKAANGTVQMIVCEQVSDDGIDYSFEHSVLVERLSGDGSLRVATHAGVVFIPSFAISEFLRAVREVMKEGER